MQRHTRLAEQNSHSSWGQTGANAPLLQEFEAKIKKASILHMEFWSKLSEENPDLNRLRDIGQKANLSTWDVEQLWLRSCDTGIDGEIMGLYGKYLIEIIGDKEAGERLLAEAKKGKNGSNNPFLRESQQMKTKEAVNFIMGKKELPLAIKRLKYMAHFLVTVFFLAVLLALPLFRPHVDPHVDNRSRINENIDLLDTSNLLHAELMNVLSKIQDLYLINNGVLNDVTYNGKIVYDPIVVRKELKESLEYIKILKEELEQQASLVSSEAYYILDSTIPLYEQNSTIPSDKSVIQAIENVVFRGFNLLAQPDSDISDSNPDYYYVTFNLLNQFNQDLYIVSERYKYQLFSTDSSQDTKKTSNKLLLVSIMGLVFIGAFVFTFMDLPSVIQRVNKVREEMLLLLINMPENMTKSNFRRCQKFSLNLGDEELESEELNTFENDGQGDIPVIGRNKRCIKLGISQDLLKIIFFGVALLLGAYFILAFRLHLSLNSINPVSEDIRARFNELSAISSSEAFFSFAINAERQLFMNPNFLILNRNAETVVLDNIKAMYDLDSLILEEHSINKENHAKTYNELFNQLMMSNPCDYMLSSVSSQTCATFADQTVFQGMTVALSRHFENLRALLSCFVVLKREGLCTIAPIVPKDLSFPQNQTFLNKTNNLLRTTQAIEIRQMQDIYIKRTFRGLMAEFKKSMLPNTQDIDTHDFDIHVMAIFITSLVVIYIFCWLLFVRNIRKEAETLEVAIWSMKSHGIIPVS